MKNKPISRKFFFFFALFFVFFLGRLALGGSSSFISPLEKEHNRRLLEDKTKEYLGARYQYGSMDLQRKRFDCSGLVWSLVFSFLEEKNFPRTSQLIFNYLRKEQEVDLQKAKRGDFVFFRRSSKSPEINHIGLYWGKNKNNEHLMYHASSSKGVEFRNISQSNYWKKKLVSVRRYRPFYQLFN